jgi:hypothetical protein
MEIDNEDQLTYGQALLSCDIYAEDDASQAKMVFASEIDRLKAAMDSTKYGIQKTECKKAIKLIKAAAEQAAKAIAM